MSDAGVRITAHRRFMQFLITKPATIEVDGVVSGEARWGAPALIETGEGAHQVTVFFPYFGRARTGEATIELHVQGGQPIELTYRSPWLVTSKGTLTVTS